MLPEGWKVEALGNLASLERGRFSARPRNDPKYYGGEIPFVQTGDVAHAGFFLDRHSQTLNELGLKVSKVFPPNTILMTIAANIGATTVARYAVACPDSVVGITARPDRADVRWLKYALESMQTDLDGMAGQNAQKNINLQMLEPLRLGVPPMGEQRLIGEVLHCWDIAIAAVEALLVNSRNQQRALTAALLERPGQPESVRHLHLSELVVESRIPGARGDTARKITVKLYGRGVVPKDERRVGSDATQYYRRKAGQFIYSKLDFLNGAFGIIPPELDGYESTLDLPAFDFRDGVDPRWFLYYVSRESFYSAHLGLANGGRKARRVNPSDLLGVAIDVPDLAEQSAIADAIDAAVAEVQAHEKMVSCLKAEKRCLMADLLTGKRRVRLPAAPEALASPA